MSLSLFSLGKFELQRCSADYKKSVRGQDDQKSGKQHEGEIL